MHMKNELGYVLQAHFILMSFFTKAPVTLSTILHKITNQLNKKSALPSC